MGPERQAAELLIDGEADHYHQEISGSVRMKLYEGSSCGTVDLDGVSPKSYYFLEAGHNTTVVVRVDNVNEGGDYAIAVRKLKAVLGAGV